MDPQTITPTTPRAKTVFFIWKILPRLVLLTLVALIVVFVMAVLKKKDLIAADKAAAVAQEKPPINSVIHPLALREIRDRINLPGNIEPWTRLELMAKVNGTVTEVFVTEGDEVEAGVILAKIEDKDYKIALKRAEAAHKLAKADYTRDKTVFAKGVIPVAQMDAKETALMTATADLENAKLQLSRCTVKAPMAGVIRRLDAKVGLLLSVADPIAEMLRIDKVKAVVGIPESDVPAVRGLDTIDVTINALDNRVITGTKHFLSPSPDTTARLYMMELEIDNPDRSILPGMFIRADVVKRSVSEAIAIPLYSVISRNNSQYVFVEEDGVAKKKNVTLGIMENWLIQVTSGLQPEDRLVIEGHRDIENDQKINVVKVVNDLSEYTL